jgi:hypothetical protein
MEIFFGRQPLIGGLYPARGINRGPFSTQPDDRRHPPTTESLFQPCKWSINDSSPCCIWKSPLSVSIWSALQLGCRHQACCPPLSQPTVVASIRRIAHICSSNGYGYRRLIAIQLTCEKLGSSSKIHSMARRPFVNGLHISNDIVSRRSRPGSAWKLYSLPSIQFSTV